MDQEKFSLTWEEDPALSPQAWRSLLSFAHFFGMDYIFFNKTICFFPDKGHFFSVALHLEEK